MAKIALISAVALLMAGCGVVSDEPLFPASQAVQHPLAEGLWAASGPGCEVKPSPQGDAPPTCAVPFTIVHGQLTWDMNALETAMGPSSHAQLPSLISGGAFRLVDGDPMIIQLTSDAPSKETPARTKPEYLALKPLGLNAKGEIDRAVLWPVICPSNPSRAPGFTFHGTQCVAQTQDAVRGAASQLRPFTSAYVTWIRREVPLAAAGPSDTALALARRYLAVRGDGDPDPLNLNIGDPKKLAIDLKLKAPVDDPVLMDSAHQAAAAALPAYRESMAKVLAEGMTGAQLSEAVEYAESKAGLAEYHKQKLIDERLEALARSAWPAFRSIHEDIVCRQLKCPWRAERPNASPPAIPLVSSVSSKALEAADHYLSSAGLYRRPAELTGAMQAYSLGQGDISDRETLMQRQGLIGESLKEQRANPDVPGERRSQLDEAATAVAAAEFLPQYRRSVVAIYAETYTVDELLGMTAHVEKQAAEDDSSYMPPVGMMMRLTMSTQRGVEADIRARYCAKVTCPPAPQPHGD